MKKACTLFFVLSLFISTKGFSRDHLIYSVAEDIPMGYDNEVNKKNYYVNIGTNQGVESGTILDVYRTISMSNPYDNLKRVNYDVKIGEIKVLHTENEASIGALKTLNTGDTSPMFELNGFIIGDKVTVNLKN